MDEKFRLDWGNENGTEGQTVKGKFRCLLRLTVGALQTDNVMAKKKINRQITFYETQHINKLLSFTNSTKNPGFISYALEGQIDYSRSNMSDCNLSR